MILLGKMALWGLSTDARQLCAGHKRRPAAACLSPRISGRGS